jgi:hypothetical protein
VKEGYRRLTWRCVSPRAVPLQDRPKMIPVADFPCFSLAVLCCVLTSTIPIPRRWRNSWRNYIMSHK